MRDSVLENRTPTNPRSAEDIFINNPSTIWPLPNSPEELLQLLNTGSDQNTTVDVQSDERSVVYSSGPITGNVDHKTDLRRITLISLDPYIRYRGLDRMKLYRSVATSELSPASQVRELEDMSSQNSGKHTKAGDTVGSPASIIPGDLHEPGANSKHLETREEAHTDDITTAHVINGSRDKNKEGLPWFRTERAMWVDISEGFHFI